MMRASKATRLADGSIDGHTVTRRARRSVHVLGVVGASCLIGLPLAVSLGAIPAGASTSTLFNQTFSNSTVTQPVTIPTAPDGSNVACLTASNTTSQTPVPGCSGTPDANGSGALRLTSAATTLEGGVFAQVSVPTSQGLDVQFKSYQFGGTGADGIGFVIAAANPTDPVAPSAIGQPGGSLGYSAGSSSPGLVDGYLGVGIDVFGNYSNDVYQGTGCTNPTWEGAVPRAGQVTVRGPGNGLVGYCGLNSTLATDANAPYDLDGGPSGTRSTSGVPVEVAVNPSTSPVVTSSGLSVPASSYAVAFTPIGGSQVTFSGALPSTLNGGITNGLYPSSWVNSSTGIPKQLTFGWVGSTGGSTDYHEVNDTGITTLLGQVPQLAVSQTLYAHTPVTAGESADLVVTPSVLAGGVAEGDPVTTNITLPAGDVPSSASGSGWTCTISGQTVSCTDDSGPFAAGSSLPSISIRSTLSSAGLTAAQISGSQAVFSSADGDPGVSNLATLVQSALGLWEVGRDGGIFAFGAAPFLGSLPKSHVVPDAPVVGIAATPTGDGYWLTGSDGGVFAFGDAVFHGSLPVSHVVPKAPVVGIAATPNGGGYWLVAADGGVFAFGDAVFHGSLPVSHVVPKAPIVGIAVTNDGGGYWLIASDGGVFAFGDAVFHGSLPASHAVPVAPVVGIAATTDGGGYWLVGSDGGVFAYGDALFHGSLPASHAKPAAPIVGISATGDGGGYWLVGTDGGMFSYGDATFDGSLPASHVIPEAPISAMAAAV